MSKAICKARDPGLVCRRWTDGSFFVVTDNGLVIGKGGKSARAAWASALVAEQTKGQP